MSNKPNWTCGMCKEVNRPRNRSRCRKCGAVKGMGMYAQFNQDKPPEVTAK